MWGVCGYCCLAVCYVYFEQQALDEAKEIKEYKKTEKVRIDSESNDEIIDCNEIQCKLSTRIGPTAEKFQS